jgi:hypothetical protein
MAAALSYHLQPAFIDRQEIDRAFSLLTMQLELEAIGKQRLQARFLIGKELVAKPWPSRGSGLGMNIEHCGI